MTRLNRSDHGEIWLIDACFIFGTANSQVCPQIHAIIFQTPLMSAEFTPWFVVGSRELNRSPLGEVALPLLGRCIYVIAQSVRAATRTSLQDDRMRALLPLAYPRDVAKCQGFVRSGGVRDFFYPGRPPFRHCGVCIRKWAPFAWRVCEPRRACESRICLRNDLGTESLAPAI